jgi:hypothetical protein
MNLIAPEQKPVIKTGVAESFIEKKAWYVRKSYVSRIAEPLSAHFLASGISAQCRLASCILCRTKKADVAYSLNFIRTDTEYSKDVKLKFFRVLVPRSASKEPRKSRSHILLYPNFLFRLFIASVWLILEIFNHGIITFSLLRVSLNEVWIRNPNQT